MSISGANGANWGNGGFGAMSVIAVLARCLTVRVVPNVYGCPRAATPKFEAKRHGASDHSNNCRLVPLANILPQTLQALLKSRARDAKGNWGIWHVVSNRSYAATAAVNEYSRRFGCEEGFRDAKWWLGFTKARIAHIKAWSRMFALFAMALLVMTSLGSKLLLTQGHRAKDLLRRVVSRRRRRCELGLVSAVVSLLQQDKTLYGELCPHVKLKLEATLGNVS